MAGEYWSRLLDNSNEEKQLDNNEISSFIEKNRKSNIITLMFGLAGATVKYDN